MRGELLFTKYSLHSALENNIQKAVKAIEEIDANQFTCSNDVEIAEHVFSKYEAEPLKIFPEEMVMEQEEVQVEM